MQTKLFSKIKNRFVPRGSGLRRIRTGPFRGLTMHLDLTTQFHVYAGTFERELHPWIRKFSRGIRSAVDIGAADGEYALYFLARTPAEHVYAFEPIPEKLYLIRANLAANGIDPSRLSISDNFVSSKAGPDSRTLDSLQAALPLPCFIKMDIDGGELDVLHSAGELLKAPQVRWLIETHSESLERDCIELLRRNGFVTRIISSAWWRFLLPEQRDEPHNRWLVAAKAGDIAI